MTSMKPYLLPQLTEVFPLGSFPSVPPFPSRLSFRLSLRARIELACDYEDLRTVDEFIKHCKEMND